MSKVNQIEKNSQSSQLENYAIQKDQKDMNSTKFILFVSFIIMLVSFTFSIIFTESPSLIISSLSLNKNVQSMIQQLKNELSKKCQQYTLFEIEIYPQNNLNISQLKVMKTVDAVIWTKMPHSDEELNNIYDKNRKSCGIVNDKKIGSQIFSYFKVRYLIFPIVGSAGQFVQQIIQEQYGKGTVRKQKKQINGTNYIIVQLLKKITPSKDGFYNGGRVSDLNYEHRNFTFLKDQLIKFYSQEKPDKIIDFGCGLAYYVINLKAAGFNAVGYDGNPQTKQVTNGAADVLNLVEPQNVGKVDWVQTFEVGEHIPLDKTDIFVKNIASHARKGIIISWGINGQLGFAHINNKDNIQVLQLFQPHGFKVDVSATIQMRNHPQLTYFRQSLLVLRKITK